MRAVAGLLTKDSGGRTGAGERPLRKEVPKTGSEFGVWVFDAVMGASCTLGRMPRDAVVSSNGSRSAPRELSAWGVPTWEAPASEAPVWEVPAWEVPACEVPAWESPAGKASAWEVPAWELTSEKRCARPKSSGIGSPFCGGSPGKSSQARELE